MSEKPAMESSQRVRQIPAQAPSGAPGCGGSDGWKRKGWAERESYRTEDGPVPSYELRLADDHWVALHATTPPTVIRLPMGIRADRGDDYVSLDDAAEWAEHIYRESLGNVRDRSARLVAEMDAALASHPDSQPPDTPTSPSGVEGRNVADWLRNEADAIFDCVSPETREEIAGRLIVLVSQNYGKLLANRDQLREMAFDEANRLYEAEEERDSRLTKEAAKAKFDEMVRFRVELSEHFAAEGEPANADRERLAASVIESTWAELEEAFGEHSTEEADQ